MLHVAEAKIWFPPPTQTFYRLYVEGDGASKNVVHELPHVPYLMFLSTRQSS